MLAVSLKYADSHLFYRSVPGTLLAKILCYNSGLAQPPSATRPGKEWNTT